MKSERTCGGAEEREQECGGEESEKGGKQNERSSASCTPCIVSVQPAQMAPKAKPKGLKASKKAPAFDPTAAAVETAPPPTEDSSSTENVERTMPLDEDHLSIADLFELRNSALALISAGADLTPEKQDEARGLLRGILHGAEALFVVFPLDTEHDDEEYDEDKFEALGLNDEWAHSFLFYLEAFALQELSALIPPPEPLAHAAIASTQGKKKRKVDLEEPQTPAEWMDEARAKYDEAFDRLTDTRDSTFFHVVLSCDSLRLNAERGLVALMNGDDKRAKQELLGTRDDQGVAGRLLWVYEGLGGLDGSGLESEDINEWVVEFCDPVLTWLRANSSAIELIEAFDTVPVKKRLEVLDEVLKYLKEGGKCVTGSNRNAEATLYNSWAFQLAVVTADAELAKFVILEDGIETKYRPDAEDEEGDDIALLPVDAEDVKAVKATAVKGRLAIAKPF